MWPLRGEEDPTLSPGVCVLAMHNGRHQGINWDVTYAIQQGPPSTKSLSSYLTFQMVHGRKLGLTSFNISLKITYWVAHYFSNLPLVRLLYNQMVAHVVNILNFDFLQLWHSSMSNQRPRKNSLHQLSSECLQSAIGLRYCTWCQNNHSQIGSLSQW